MKKLFFYLITMLFLTLRLAAEETLSLDSLEEIFCTYEPIEMSHHHKDSNESDLKKHHHFKRKKVDEGSRPLIEPTNLLEATSINWSGYVAATLLASPARGTVTNVSGSWTVPTLHPTPDNSFAAYWVGIDGFKSTTVEQIGTLSEWVNNRQVNWAWFEMYPNPSYQIVGFPAGPNDVLAGNVTYAGNNVFKMTLINYTKKVFVTIPTFYTTSRSAARLCAEWIAEAPSSSSGVLPLANFGKVVFTNCLATINGFTGPINSPRWQNTSLNMVTPQGILKAVTSPLINNENFTVTWEHE